MTSIKTRSKTNKEENGNDLLFKKPRLVAQSVETNRPDQHNHTNASEFVDEPDALSAKIIKVAELMRSSKHTVVYSGAGLSRSSGIPDYATRAKSTISTKPKLKDPLDALPTIAHDALASIYRAGLIHEFVNQNHDALFEKAGVPVICSNLLHGDWFDVSNPVVQYNENLREDLYDRFRATEKRATLVLVIGTSLSGMTSDDLAITSMTKRGKHGVIVNLQATWLDAKASVRVWAKTDDFFPMLAEELGILVTQIRPVLENPMETRFHLRWYDATTGARQSKEEDNEGLVLDLSPGAMIKVVYPGASNFGRVMKCAKNRDGMGNFIVKEQDSIGRFSLPNRLGLWFIQAALQGELAHFPCVNV